MAASTVAPVTSADASCIPSKIGLSSLPNPNGSCTSMEGRRAAPRTAAI
jgi:hypothetical protein